ncbi:GH23709 [Drosophila grimshawi]|uniref:GH23709 n=1 Tax=Drosophila grimshawi TaxID=7222 RepID=B4K462_DROGR|nr:GH23709 [Drosophila grimshawi]
MSFPRPGCSSREDRGGLLDRGRNNMCGRGSQRGILTGTVPCALNSALRGDHRPAVGSAPGTSWDLTLTLTLPRTGTLPRNLSLPRSLILHLSRLLAWALTSALEGDHETGVASALATSLARTLTLAKALPSWGPNSNV